MKCGDNREGSERAYEWCSHGRSTLEDCAVPDMLVARFYSSGMSRDVEQQAHSPLNARRHHLNMGRTTSLRTGARLSRRARYY